MPLYLGRPSGVRWLASPADTQPAQNDLLARYAADDIDGDSLVKALQAKYPVFMLTKEKCPFCRRAKKLFDDIGASYGILQLDELPKERKTSLQEYFKEATGAGSVPRVYVGGTCVGGFSETQRKLWTGDLVPLLLQAGAMDPEAALAATFDENPLL